MSPRLASSRLPHVFSSLHNVQNYASAGDVLICKLRKVQNYASAGDALICTLRNVQNYMSAGGALVCTLLPIPFTNSRHYGRTAIPSHVSGRVSYPA